MAETKTCECGCGETANPGKRFVQGHHNVLRRKTATLLPATTPTPAPPANGTFRLPIVLPGMDEVSDKILALEAELSFWRRLAEVLKGKPQGSA